MPDVIANLWSLLAVPYSGQTIAILCLAIFVAGLARGFSGFGAALIFVPLASASIGPKLAGPILLTIDIVAAAGMLPDACRRADKADVTAMAAGALFAVPLGALALVHLDPLVVRWVISITAGLFLALLVSGWRYNGRPFVPLAMAVGAISGIYSGAAQLGGPPVVAYWLGGQRTAATVRGNIVLFFGISSVISAVSYLLTGLLPPTVFKLAVICGPLYAIGLLIGSRLFGLASEKTFRWACYILIGLAAVTSLPLLDGILR